MDERYSIEDIARLKGETLAIMRRRIVAEGKMTFLEDEGRLESMCRIDGVSEEAFRHRCEKLCRLTALCAGYLRQEVEAAKKYVNACWVYQLDTGKPL